MGKDASAGFAPALGFAIHQDRILAFSFPLFFSGIADICEWYDQAIEKYRIEVNVHNRTWGRLFGYRGSFDMEWKKVAPDEIPDDIKPRRLERRE
jgi:hypothetical protein